MSGFIRKRTLSTGKVRYYPVLTVNEQQKSLGGFSRRRDAEARLQRAEGELAGGTLYAEDLDFSSYYERWIESKHDLKKSTLHDYKLTFRLHILPCFKGWQLQGITPEAVQQWVNELAAGDLGPASVRRCYRYLRSCLNQAVKWDAITSSPCRGIVLPRLPGEEIDFLEPEEISKLLEKVKDPERTLFAVLGLSGIRIGEALALRRRDIDYKNNAIIVQRSWNIHNGFTEPKTRSSRRAVPLLPTLAGILEDYTLKEAAPDTLLFSHDGEKPLDPSNIRLKFNKALKAAKIKHVTIHSLRHSYASVMLASGSSIKALQRALGHSSATTTLDVYSHLLQEDMTSSIMRADQVFSGAEGKVIQLPRGRSVRE